MHISLLTAIFSGSLFAHFWSVSIINYIISRRMSLSCTILRSGLQRRRSRCRTLQPPCWLLFEQQTAPALNHNVELLTTSAWLFELTNQEPGGFVIRVVERPAAPIGLFWKIHVPVHSKSCFILVQVHKEVYNIHRGCVHKKSPARTVQLSNLLRDAIALISFTETLLASTVSSLSTMLDYELKPCFAYLFIKYGNAFWKQSESFPHPTNLQFSGSCRYTFVGNKVQV